MGWGILVHPDVASWLMTVSEKDYQHVLAAFSALSVDGPALGRPFVDTLRGTRVSNLKELRPRGSNIRLLFAFDPARQAVVLAGGDKTNQWQRWYERNIPVAEERFADHCRKLAVGDVS